MLSYCPVNVAVAVGNAAPLVFSARLTGAGGLTWTVTVVVSPVAGTTPRTVNLPGAATAEAASHTTSSGNVPPTRASR